MDIGVLGSVFIHLRLPPQTDYEPCVGEDSACQLYIPSCLDGRRLKKMFAGSMDSKQQRTKGIFTFGLSHSFSLPLNISQWRVDIPGWEGPLCVQ